MTSFMKKLASASALLIATSAFNIASAQLMTVEFNNGDSLADWSVDRAAPNGFEIVNNELVVSVGGNYDPNNPDAFDHTKGMKLDTGKANFMSIDMYIDSNWVGGSEGRLGGFWATAFDSVAAISAFPIIEYRNHPTLGGLIAYWDSNLGFMGSFVSIDLNAFNTFSYEITANGLEYSVNNTVIHVDAVSNIDYLGNVILNSKFEGVEYDVRYDNLVYGYVPEPSVFALFALGFAGLVMRKKQQ